MVFPINYMWAPTSPFPSPLIHSSKYNSRASQLVVSSYTWINSGVSQIIGLGSLAIDTFTNWLIYQTLSHVQYSHPPIRLQNPTFCYGHVCMYVNVYNLNTFKIRHMHVSFVSTSSLTISRATFLYGYLYVHPYLLIVRSCYVQILLSHSLFMYVCLDMV